MWFLIHVSGHAGQTNKPTDRHTNHNTPEDKVTIQTVPAVPPSRYTGMDHEDGGILELKTYNSCVSLGVEPMYTFPISTTNHNNTIYPDD